MGWFGKKKKEENTSPKFSAEEEKVIDTIMTAQAPIDVRQAVGMIDSLVQTQMSNLVLQLQVHRLISESDIWEGVESSLRNPEHKHMFALIADLPSQMKDEQTQSGLPVNVNTVSYYVRFAAQAADNDMEPFIVMLSENGDELLAHGGNFFWADDVLEIDNSAVQSLKENITELLRMHQETTGGLPSEAILVLLFRDMQEGVYLIENSYSVLQDLGIKTPGNIVIANNQVAFVHYK